MFRSARLKLTLYYLMIIMLISMAFSFFIYEVLMNEVQRFADSQRVRIERQMYANQFLPPSYRVPTPSPDEFTYELLKETQARLIFALIIVNGSILIVSGGLGYFLAGKTLKPIQLMLEEQNRFISDSSHEFRTPLTSLKTALEVSLRDKQLKLSEAKEILSESIEEVNKLQALSDGLLQLAQYQKIKNRTLFKPLSLNEVVTDAVKKVAPLAKAKSISLQNNVTDIQFEGSLFSLTDLLVILLDNAIKYTPNGKEIVITSKQKDKTIQIIVQDQGIGIDEKDIPHLFDRFFRSDSARTKSGAGGYGLGLSIAKQIVEAHRGLIFVKKNTNEGSTFIVQLPTRQIVFTKPKLFR